MKAKQYEALIARCKQLDEQKSWDEVIELLSEALSKEPLESRLYYERGLRNESQGSFSKAYGDFSTAIRLEPGVSDYFSARGRVLCAGLSRFSEAINDYKTSIEIAPNSPAPYQHLSVCYLSLDDIRSATQSAVLALELNSNDSLSYYCLARCQIAGAEFSEAVKALKNAVEIEPDSAMYWGALGDCFVEIDSSLEARECYETAIKHDRKSGYFVKLAKVLIDIGQVNKALENLEIATELGLSVVEKVLVDGYKNIATQEPS